MYTYYDLVSLQELPEQEWIIEGFLPHKSIIVLYGSPGSCKTFVALDISLRIANCLEWNKMAINKPGIVIYILGEGLNGIKKRIYSWHKYNKTSPSSTFITLPVSFNLSEEKDVHNLLSTIEHIETKFNDKVVLIVIDTLARAITGIDENSSKDMNEVIKVVDKIKTYTNSSIMLVHHCGKDYTKGMRGSSALLGAVDCCMQVRKKETNVELQIEKQKDGEPFNIELKMEKCENSLVVSNYEKKKFDTPLLDIENKGKKWTKQEQDELVEEIKTLDVYDIAKKHGRTIGGIRSRFSRIIVLNGDEELSREQIKEKYNISQDSVLPLRLF
jgi:RecA-family ATPase